MIASDVRPDQPAADRATGLEQFARHEGLIARFGIVATGASFLAVGQEINGYLNLRDNHAFLVLDLLTYLTGFALLAYGVFTKVSLRHAGTIVIVMTVLGLGLSFFARIEGRPGYSSDIAVFTHSATELLLEGKNPYAMQEEAYLIAQSERFNHPPFIITRLADGTLINRLMVYPAGHVLLFAPFVALGLDDIQWVASAAALGVLALLWWQSPTLLRPIVALPVLIDPVPSVFYPTGGVVDHIWLLPLMGVAIAMNRGRWGIGALLFGVACAIKQTPWVLAPFLLIWVWHESRHLEPRERLKLLARYVAIAAGVFLLVNAPFMIWSFSDWLTSITFHLHTPLGLLGTGIVNLTIMDFVEISRTTMSLLALVVLALLLVLYFRFYSQLKHTMWVYPGVVLWFTYRSLQSYFVFWTPLLLLSIIVAHGRNSDASRTED